MPIEFRCTQCDRLLRTPDGTSGKDAKCPQCGTILKIPEVAPAQPAPAEASPHPVPPQLRETLAAGDVQNPYQSPSAMAMEAPTVARGFQPTVIDFADTFSRTWQLFKRNLGPCIAGTLLTFGCSFVANIILSLFFVMIKSDLRGGALVSVSIIEQVVSQAVGSFFWIGLILFMLKIARSETADFAALFGAGPYFLYGVVIQIIVTLAFFVGLVLLVVPGIIIGLMLSQAMFMLVDQRADIMGSLRLSIAATNGNKLTLLAIYIVGAVGSMLVVLFTCGVGALFAMPFMALLTTMIYLGVTGQATALDNLPQQPMAERPFGAPGAQPMM